MILRSGLSSLVLCCRARWPRLLAGLAEMEASLCCWWSTPVRAAVTAAIVRGGVLLLHRSVDMGGRGLVIPWRLVD